MSKHFAMVGRKKTLFTGRYLQQNQAQREAAVCHNLLGVRGKRKEGKEKEKKKIKDNKQNKIKSMGKTCAKG